MAKCEICSSSDIKNLFKKDNYTYQQCRKCGLIRIYPQPSAKYLDGIYNGAYYENWGPSEAFFSEMKKKIFNRLLDMLPFKNVQNKRFLDIGAATGLMMETARYRGFDVFGIEAALYGADIIKEKFGKDKIFNCYFDNTFKQKYPIENKFDVIVMSDLFEHLQNPGIMLDLISELLNAGGYIIIAFPDTSSLSCKILGKHWPHFISEHLFSYSNRNICELLKKHSFDIISVKPQTKYLTMQYTKCWFEARTTPLDKLLLKLINLFPKFTLNYPIPVRIGQTAVIARKKL
ncbi:MAG: class I SAM-dependent methyltransferase [Endomicrobium sp.]|jgi:SAM-dependent methyltransferase|nr:class I SAM-dependent methyltransferase [Endomicrobium sp.]